MKKTFLYLLGPDELKFKCSLPAHIEVDYQTKVIGSSLLNVITSINISPTIFINLKYPENTLSNIEAAMANNAASYWSDVKERRATA